MVSLERRPTRRTRAKQRDDKPTIEARLLAATERLLDQGQRFGSLSVEQLTEEAGIARATFYLHFRDKGEFVARLMGQVTEELVASTGIWLNRAETAQSRDIRAAMIGVVATFEKHRAIFTAINDTAPYDETVAALYRTMMDRICQSSRHSFRVVRNKGLSRRGSNDDVADVMSWMVVLYCARMGQIRAKTDTRGLAKTLSYICASVIFADEPDASEPAPPAAEPAPKRQNARRGSSRKGDIR